MNITIKISVSATCSLCEKQIEARKALLPEMAPAIANEMAALAERELREEMAERGWSSEFCGTCRDLGVQGSAAFSKKKLERGIASRPR